MQHRHLSGLPMTAPSLVVCIYVHLPRNGSIVRSSPCVARPPPPPPLPKMRSPTSTKRHAREGYKKRMGRRAARYSTSPLGIYPIPTTRFGTFIRRASRTSMSVGGRPPVACVAGREHGNEVPSWSLWTDTMVPMSTESAAEASSILVHTTGEPLGLYQSTGRQDSWRPPAGFRATPLCSVQAPRPSQMIIVVIGTGSLVCTPFCTS